LESSYIRGGERMNTLIKGYKIVLAVLAAALILTGCSTSADSNGKENIFGTSEGLVYQGTIEAKEVSINSKIPGRILKILVEEGAEVKAGDVLVEIESEELKAKKAQAEALLQQAMAGYEAAKGQEDAAQAGYDAAKGQLDAANSQLQKAENGARAQEIAQAQAYYELMQKTYDRVQKLYEKGAVSAQKRDEVYTQLEVAKQQLSIAKEGARVEDKSGAQALVNQAMAGVQAALAKVDQAKAATQAAAEKVEQAKAGVAEVEAYLKDTKIAAPINGVVTEINAHEGELVSTGMSIAVVSDIENAWIEVQVKETDLEKITLGQNVEVKVPSYSKETFKGKVVRINQKPDFATKRATNDNGDFDIMSFGVKVELDDRGSKALRPGMTAFVRFVK